MSKLLVTMLTSLFALSFTFFLVTLVMGGRHQDIGCINGGASALNQHSTRVSICHFESFAIIWVATAVAFQWMGICIDVASKTVLNVRLTADRQKQFERVLIGISFAVPTFFLILTLSYTQLGRSINVPWCLMGGGGKSTPNLDWSVTSISSLFSSHMHFYRPFFYLPVLIALLIGTFCIIPVLYNIWKSTDRLATAQKSSMREAFVRTLVFMVYFMFMCQWIFGLSAVSHLLSQISW